MRGELTRIGNEYANASKEGFAGHQLAKAIRENAGAAVRAALGDGFAQYLVEGSPGKGRWAEVPWIGVFDPAVTSSATCGYYVVYLFAVGSRRLYLSLNQGTTAVREEFKGRTRDVLRDRARLMRMRIGAVSARFTFDPIALGSEAILPGDYEAGHIVGTRYDVEALPAEERLRQDLGELIRHYQQLTYHGGFDSPSEEDEERIEQIERPLATTVDERRQYRLHKKIERRSRTSELVKRHHGTTCQVCGLSFAQKYGHLGEGFIEAHHRRPLSALKPGATVSYNIETDFCVLCANCHRMIHRLADPSDIEALRALISR